MQNPFLTFILGWIFMEGSFSLGNRCVDSFNKAMKLQQGNRDDDEDSTK
jgi:hypothetical protein